MRKIDTILFNVKQEYFQSHSNSTQYFLVTSKNLKYNYNNQSKNVNIMAAPGHKMKYSTIT